jgi:undecaprenyl-diphosphatase
VKNQIHAKAFVGWHLIAGLLVFATMTLILGEMGENISNGQPLTLVDLKLTAWLTTNRSPAVTTLIWLATSLGSTWVASCTAVIAGLYLLWRRQPYWCTTVCLSVFGGMALNRLLKYTFHRPRPYFDDPILSLTGYSFPSGHTMTATVLYGVLAAYLISRIGKFRERVLVFLCASILIALVGFSRIYLGAHYLSDVLGAIAEGLAWLSLCLTTLYTVWHNRNHRPV